MMSMIPSTFRHFCPSITGSRSKPSPLRNTPAGSMPSKSTCPGAWEPGGGGQGGQLPPNFLSQGDGYACGPLNFGNH